MDIDLDRRIGFSPHFSVHVVGDNQLLLLSEQRSFRLSGKLYVAMAPFLDGTRTGDDVLAAFAGRAPDERVRAALTNLVGKKYAIYVDATAPAGRQALWAELGLVPADAESQLARHAIAVRTLPGDRAAAEAARLLRRAAADAGLRVVPEKAADLTIVCIQDYLHRGLARLNRAMRRAGRAWAPFKAGGSMPLFGPLFRPHDAPCWACLANRMSENRPGDRLVADTVPAARPARAGNRATLSYAASFAATELARAFAGNEPSGLERRIVSLELRNGSAREHMIRLDPNCPVCGEHHDPEVALARAMVPLELRVSPMQLQADGGWRVFPATEVVKRLERYVSPITGIIADLEDTSPDDGLPVFRANQANPVRTGLRENRLVGRPGAAAGKGMGPAQAKASCLAEAVERYLSGFTGAEPRKRAAWAALGKAAPHPYSYLNFSERQFDSRDAWNARHNGFNWVGERFDESREIEWTPAWSLTHGEQRWLPTRFCYFNYADSSAAAGSRENFFCNADSNGCASGSTLEEAVLQGFLELAERDACAMWWYNRVQRPAFDLDASHDPFVHRVQALYAKRGRGLHVLDLTNDLGIPVAIALSYREGDGKSIVLGLGAHLDANLAVNRALAEMNQMMTLETVVTRADEMAKAEGDEAVMFDWLTNRGLGTETHCVPDGRVDLGAYARPSVADLKEAVDHCLRAVSDKGFEMIVVDHRRPEIDFATVRVVVPGMRHFWARFREGRLYQAPVDMGWLDRPKAETDLNPIPFFL